MIHVAAKETGIVFPVRVQPRASRSQVTGELDGALKIRLAAPPVDGQANEELIRFLAKLFRVSRQQVTILSGLTSKNKVIGIAGISLDASKRVLEAATTG